MYYIVCNTADIPEASETTRTSVDGTQAILDDTQFAELNVGEISCKILDHQTALTLMQTPEWATAE